jgi:SAM-dependent methyltransferase
MSTVHDALQALTDLTPSRQQILADALAGLSCASRQLPSKYFYDARGSRLFEQITQTREYYPTRTELALLARVLPDIARVVGPRLHVVELGSGSGRKTALLLAALQDPVAYTPIEISRAALLSSIDHLAPALPEVEMLPVCADFTRAVAVPMPEREPARRLLFFPGSTLGNFAEAEAVALLRAMRQTMGRDGLALIGIDLHKDTASLRHSPSICWPASTARSEAISISMDSATAPVTTPRGCASKPTWSASGRRTSTSVAAPSTLLPVNPSASSTATSTPMTASRRCCSRRACRSHSVGMPKVPPMACACCALPRGDGQPVPLQVRPHCCP